jgi:predicted transcriptional regulator
MFSDMKTAEQVRARELRSEGRSMKEIARLVGCALSSVSSWTRDIELTPEQCAALRSRNPAINGQLVAAANASRARARRAAF